MNTTAVAPGSRSLLQMTRAELDDLYRSSTPGPTPTGDTQGTAIAFPGTFVAQIFATLVSWLVWQGKVFDPSRGELRNKVSPVGFLSIRAKVYSDDSWMDGRPTIVIDYSKTSFVAQKIRDEIREVAPGVYLGKVWWGKHRILDFTLRT
jgi:hypothetical protein